MRQWQIYTFLVCFLPVSLVAAPQRVVSLDYCADQYVIQLVPHEHIVGVSPDAIKAFSYLRAEASQLPSVRPVAENILLLQPDVVVRSYGGGPRIAAFLERLDVPVVQLAYSRRLSDIPATIRDVATALGAKQAGDDLAVQMENRMQRIADSKLTGQPLYAMYMTYTGVTSGGNTLINDMIEAAGLRNFESRSGWQPLPLERLVFEAPDVLARAFYQDRDRHADTWSAARHPVLQMRAEEITTVPLQGAWTACGGWFVMDAIEALHEVTKGRMQRSGAARSGLPVSKPSS